MKQALKLESIVILIGIGLGYSIGVILMPIVIKISNYEYSENSINPIIFVISIVFTLITVLISANKPAKIASNISPIESVRYIGVNELGKRNIKKSVHWAKINRMV